MTRRRRDSGTSYPVSRLTASLRRGGLPARGEARPAGCSHRCRWAVGERPDGGGDHAPPTAGSPTFSPDCNLPGQAAAASTDRRYRPRGRHGSTSTFDDRRQRLRVPVIRGGPGNQLAERSRCMDRTSGCRNPHYARRARPLRAVRACLMSVKFPVPSGSFSTRSDLQGAPEEVSGGGDTQVTGRALFSKPARPRSDCHEDMAR